MAKKIGWLSAFVLTVVAANWAIEQYGFVSVGFGLTAPAGVYFAGLAFTLRDVIHERYDRRYVFGAIALGAVLSAGVSSDLALASGVAFGVSELADYSVYAPLREKNWTLAALASNAVGAVVDSALFLWLAFGSLAFIEGQIVGKMWVTLLAVGLWRWLRLRST